MVKFNIDIYYSDGVRIGDDSRIAPYTIISTINHIYMDPIIPIWKKEDTAKGIEIGNDMWIGSNVKIMDGVTIGEGSVIGAGSAVVKDIPPMSIAVGVPAKVIKKRDE